MLTGVPELLLVPRLYFFNCGNVQPYKRTHIKLYLYFSAPIGEEGKNLLFTSKFMLIHFQLPFFCVCVCKVVVTVCSCLPQNLLLAAATMPLQLVGSLEVCQRARRI